MTFAPPTALYLNGQDTARLGFVLEAVPGVFDGLNRTDSLVTLPHAPGGVLPSTPGRVEPKQLTLEGTLPATTRAALEAAKHALKALCGSGTVEIRLVSQDIVFQGRLAGITVTHFSPQLRDGTNAARVALRFVCPDPCGWDRTAQLTAFRATPVALTLGTAPSRGRTRYGALITIQGAATTPTLREYDAAGTLLRSMAFTWSPTVNDAIEIDCARGTVTRIQSGVRDNGLPFVSAGFEFPRLDPDDGAYESSAFPQLAVTSGVGLARYFRSWQ